MVELDIYDGCGLIQFESIDKNKEIMNIEISGLKGYIIPIDFKKYLDSKANDK